ncbi:MAG TPA: hypothetical protein EYQ85_04510 [Candidatus Poseidoniales archaeon]|nr:MAG: hypothetical protein CXT68_00925 [Euryarchaeota archaeon]HIF16496.1 hypothetical protein [Candidatus Poseidoniales archaeon]
MAGKKLSKAKRGKRRWIGLEVPSTTTRDSLNEILPKGYRLYDLVDEKAIIRVKLQDYSSSREVLEKLGLKTNTASGKIKLVRERLGIQKPPRKRGS